MTSRPPAAPRRAAVPLAAIALASAIGCGGAKPPKTPSLPDGPTHESRSTERDRKEVAVTVYNDDFGVVREVRDVALGEGRVQLEFQDVASGIEPTTVQVRSLAKDGGFFVAEQNYRYDLLTPETLLRKHVGHKVKVLRWNEASGRDEERDAEVLSTEAGVVLRIGDEITSGYPGRIAFPSVPPNLVSKPTLVWLLGSTAPRQPLEVTYRTSGLNWRADYVVVLDENDTRADVTGWVTLTNASGASFPAARLSLVAGDVRRVREQTELVSVQEDQEAQASGGEGGSFREESFFEYHLYSLERPTDLLDREQKQVSLLEAAGVAVRKKLVLDAHEPHIFFYAIAEPLPKAKVSVYIELENKKDRGLGMPLPKGIVRVYKSDRSGARQFVGEDRIDHTPRDETIALKVGEAFDIVAERKQTDFRQLGPCETESAWEVELRNTKDADVRVEVNERVPLGFQILDASHASTKKDATTLVFDIPVGPRARVVLAYRIRTRSC